MEKQKGWIDDLFAKWGRLYGSTLSSLWAGIAVEEVKEELRRQLQAYTRLQIAWAVEACARESDLAPTVPRFMRCVREAPRPADLLALPNLPTRPDPSIFKLMKQIIATKVDRQ